jgi:hypothetical protein
MAGKIWIPSDLVLLIAWLEFCLQNGFNFETTIIERLRESRKRQTGQEYPFAWKQVTDKLVDLARRDKDPKGYTKDYARIDEILLKGSNCFPHRARELQSQIDVAVEQFQQSYARSEPQNANGTSQKPSERNEREARLPEDSESAEGHAREALPAPRLFPNLVSISYSGLALTRRYAKV